MIEDQFHDISMKFEKRYSKDHENILDNIYELTQAILIIIFSQTMPKDFEDEIYQINVAIMNLCKNDMKLNASELPVDIKLRHILLFREYVNLYKIQAAVSSATPKQLDQSRHAWTQVCRFFELASGGGTRSAVGLTLPRRMRVVFGPIVLSFLLIGLEAVLKQDGGG
jgi:hypothetical protein